MSKKIRWNNIECHFLPEIEVTYLSSGYRDPGQYYGRPENCYPAEGDEERTIKSITIDGKKLPAALVDALAPYLQEQMESEDGPDDVEDYGDDYDRDE